MYCVEIHSTVRTKKCYLIPRYLSTTGSSASNCRYITILTCSCCPPSAGILTFKCQTVGCPIYVLMFLFCVCIVLLILRKLLICDFPQRNALFKLMFDPFWSTIIYVLIIASNDVNASIQLLGE